MSNITSDFQKHSKSCLVLDLDETLVHFFGSEDDWDFIEDYESNEVRSRILDIKVEGEFMWGVARPYTKEFLYNVQSLFDVVGIWSAGVKSYVEEIAKELFPVTQPYFVWSRDKCIVMTTNTNTVRQKPLSKLFAAFPEIDPKRTLILDDRSEVCHQDTLSHIDMPVWDATFSDIDRTDISLKCICEWMKEIVPTSRNYRTAITKGIFCPSQTKINNKLQSNLSSYQNSNYEFW